jgi:hypothetical protein
MSVSMSSDVGLATKTSSQVSGSVEQIHFVVPEHPQPDIASEAEKSTNRPGRVVVIYAGVGAATHLIATDSASTALLFEKVKELFARYPIQLQAKPTRRAETEPAVGPFWMT